jgi:hypothetical protein
MPTAFPKLKPPDGSPAEMCPLIYGKNPIAVAQADTTYQRLLKARIHLCCLELAVSAENESKPGTDFCNELQCQVELLSLLAELWPNAPDKLVPWREEVLVLAKFNENLARRRLTREGDPKLLRGITNLTLSALTRHRLAVETALWKGKNGK